MEEAKTVAVEKLKEAALSVGNFGVEVLNVAVGDEKVADRIHHWLHVARPYIIAAVVLAVIIRCGCCCGRPGKTMKAPGRNYRMSRQAFEGNPRGYFRNNRAHQM